MATSSLSIALQALLDTAVLRGTAPGVVGVVFDRNGTLTSAASGVRNSITGEPMTLETVCWTASMSKTVASYAALVLVEKMSPRFDFDSNDALAEWLPELKLGNGRGTDFIFDGKDEDGAWKLRPAKVGITLRHLLLHSAGFGYTFTSEETASKYPPYGDLPDVVVGHIAGLDVPRVFEAGTGWQYGYSSEWLGRFIERVSNQTLRSAFQTLVFDPLHLPAHTIDTFRTPEMSVNRSQIHAPVGDGSFVPIPFDTVQFEGVPPEGMAPLATAAVWATIPSFAIFLRSMLNHSAATPGGPPILSRKLWDEASTDGLQRVELELPVPVIKSSDPQMTCDLERETTPKGDPVPEGWTLLQAALTNTASVSGRTPGTLSWGGLANSFYFVDPASGVGGVIAAQFFPYAHPEMIKLRDEFETLVYSSIA